jgi:hypothetical protein
MATLIATVGCNQDAASSKTEAATCLNSQRFGIVQVGNTKGVLPALGYLALAFAQGNDLVGYSLGGRKFKTVLLTSVEREARIRKSLQASIAKLEASGQLKIVTSKDLVKHDHEKPSSREITRRLNGVLSDVEIVIIDGDGLGDANDQRVKGFAPTGYEDVVVDYFIASVPKRVSTIIVGQGDCSEAFERWDPKSTFDHELSLYRFGNKPGPLSFLVHWVRSGGADMPVDELQVSWREKTSAGSNGWQIESGVADSDPILEFAVHLRRQGLTYQRIGDLLGCARSTIHRWLTAGSSDIPAKSR